MAARRSKAKTGTVKVNFKGVESRRTPKEGDYILEVLEATSEQSSSGNDQIKFVLEIAQGEYKGTKVYFYCPLAENSLWKLHAFLTAMGEDVPEDEMDIDLADLIGKRVVGVLTHETYNGKKTAKMTDFDSVDNYTGDDGDDDKSSKGSKKDAEKETYTKDEIEAMDEDDLDEVIEKHNLEIKGYKKLKKPREKIEAVIEALDEEDLIGEDENQTYTKDQIEEMDLDDLEEVIKDNKLDVDFKGLKKKLPKLVAAVIEALDEGDQIVEPKKADKKSNKKKTYTTDEIGDMDEDELQGVIDAEELEVDLDDFKKLTKKQSAVVDALEANEQIDDD